MTTKRRSFFDRLTGSVKAEEEEYEDLEPVTPSTNGAKRIEIHHEEGNERDGWMEEEPEEAELAVDVYETPSQIVIQTFTAGVKNDNLELTIARDVVTIKGKREANKKIDHESYFTRELYWGKFSRTILLPQEVEPDEAKAVEKHGLLTIELQKIDREKKNTIKVKSVH